MIYTIGSTTSYEQIFKEQEQPMKLGREDDYLGGVVWKTLEEAKINCPEGYSVYGVNADWSSDTAEAADPIKFAGRTLSNFRYLVKTSPLVRV